MADEQYRVKSKNLYITLTHEFAEKVLIGIANAEVRVYIALQIRANKNDKETWVSQTTLGAMCKLSSRWVRDSIKKLERMKIIEVNRQEGKSNLIKILKN